MPRTRTEGTAVPVYGNSGQQTCATYPTLNAWAYNNTSIGNLARNGRIRTTVDEVVQNFKKRSAAGEIFNNPFYTVEEVFVCSGPSGTVNAAYRNPPHIPYSGVVVNSFHTGHTARYANIAAVPPVSPSIDLQTAITLAGTDALSKVASPEVQGQVDLIEMRKTIQLLKSPLKSLAEKSAKLKSEWGRYRKNPAKYRWSKGNAPSAGEVFKDFNSFASQKWLEYRYGWTPLIMSVSGTMTALAKERKHPRQTARGSSPIPIQSGTRTNVDYNAGSHSQVWNRTIETKVTAGVLYESSMSLSNDLGFSLHEIPSTAWELIPFSFVADWFVNAGSWIRAVTPKAGVVELARWTTIRSIEKVSVVNTKTKPADETYYTFSGGGIQYSISYTRTTKDRRPYISVGLSSKLQEIFFSKPKDFKHAVDMFALISQNLGR